jgi:hypothetical protein
VNGSERERAGVNGSERECAGVRGGASLFVRELRSLSFVWGLALDEVGGGPFFLHAAAVLPVPSPNGHRGEGSAGCAAASRSFRTDAAIR